MIVLALDAALGAFSAAVHVPGREAASKELPGGVALERGLEAVRQVLEQAAVAPAQLDRLAVGVGPGSFTGVRIALSYAKSLAQGWRLPLVGVNSFDAIEAGLTIDPDQPLLTVVRGRRGVVSARLRCDGQERRASGYVAQVIAALAPALGRGPLQLTGDVQDVIAALGERGHDVRIHESAIAPPALAIAMLAHSREPAASFHEVRADYGELPAVTP